MAAVHIGVNPERTRRARQVWDEKIGEGELVVIPSPYRQLNRPIRTYIKQMLKENPNAFVHVVVGHLAMDSAWKQMLHQNSVLIFNMALSGLERVVVTIVPFQIRREESQEGVVDRNRFTRQDLRRDGGD